MERYEGPGGHHVTVIYEQSQRRYRRQEGFLQKMRTKKEHKLWQNKHRLIRQGGKEFEKCIAKKIKTNTKILFSYLRTRIPERVVAGPLANKGE